MSTRLLPQLHKVVSCIYIPAQFILTTAYAAHKRHTFLGDAALKKVRKGGTVISVGIHMSDVPQFPYRLLYGERIMKSVANDTFSDGAELLKLAMEIPIRTEVKLYELHNANEALNDLKASRFNGATVLTTN